MGNKEKREENKGSEMREEREEAHEDLWRKEKIAGDRLCHVKPSLSTHVLPFSSSSLPLSVNNTIVNHGGIDYKGLIFSTSEQEHDSGSGGEVASAACA